MDQFFLLIHNKKNKLFEKLMGIQKTSIFSLVILVFLTSIVSSVPVGWSGDMRLTNNTAISYGASIAIDPYNDVHIVWVDYRDGNPEIYYTKLDKYGNTLIDDTRLTNNSLDSYGPYIAIDSNRNAHIVWYDLRDWDYEIYYTKLNRTGSKLISDTRLTFATGASTSPSIAVDSSGNVHIAWEDERDQFEIAPEIYYTKLNNNGTTIINDINLTILDETISRFPSIAVDSNGNVHIAWEDYRDGNYEIYYTKLNNNGVTLVDDKRLTSDPATSIGPTIAVDSDTNIHIAWQELKGNYSIYYTKLDNSGNDLISDKNLTLTFTTWDSMSPSIVVGSIHVAWYDNRDYVDGNYTEIYYTKLNKTGSTLIDDTRLTTVDQKDSNFPSIAADSIGNVHVVWVDMRDGNKEIYYKRTTIPTYEYQVIADLGQKVTWLEYAADVVLGNAAGQVNFTNKDQYFIVDIRDLGPTAANFSNKIGNGTYYQAHIPGAWNIYWRDILKPENLDLIKTKAAGKTILLYHNSHTQAGMTAFALNLLNYTTTENKTGAKWLRWGLAAWNQSVPLGYFKVNNTYLKGSNRYKNSSSMGYPKSRINFTSPGYAYAVPNTTGLPSGANNYTIIRKVADNWLSSDKPTKTEPFLTNATQLKKLLDDNNDGIIAGPGDDLTNDPFVLDDRHRTAYLAGHINTSVLVQLNNTMSPTLATYRILAEKNKTHGYYNLKKVPPDKTVVVQCTMGVTQTPNSMLLYMLGYKALDFKWGIVGWNGTLTPDKKGYAVESGDSVKPNVTLKGPANNSVFSTDTIYFNFTAIDNADALIGYTIYINGTTPVTGTAKRNVQTNVSVSSLCGPHSWYVTVTDDLGNSNTSAVRVFTGPPCVPEFPIGIIPMLFLLMTIGTMIHHHIKINKIACVLN